MTTRFKTSLAAALAVVTIAAAAPMLMAAASAKATVDKLAYRLRVDRAGRACAAAGRWVSDPGSMSSI